MMPKRLWSKEKVIAELRRLRRDGPKHHPRLDAAARRHFGSLRAALQVAELPCTRRMPPYHVWSREAVIEAIRKRHRNGQGLERVNRDDRLLYSAAKRLFGNWSAARSAAGLPRPVREFYSADEVQLWIIGLYEQELPLKLQAGLDPKLHRSIRRHFGTWRRAVESLGLGSELRPKWTKQKVIDAILYRRALGLSLAASQRGDTRLYRAAVTQFGNWHNALQAAGIDGRIRERWSKEKVIERLRHHMHSAADQQFNRIDPRLADAARRRFGSLRKAIKAAGVARSPRKPRCVR